MYTIQKDEDSLPILDSLGNTIQDVVSTLILTITLHFIGNSSHLKDKNVDYPTLGAKNLVTSNGIDRLSLLG